MKVLCLCPIGIGNYLLIYPACGFLKKTYPEIVLYLLGPRAAIREMAANDPLWSGVIAFDATASLRNPAAALAIVNRLRREKFDACLALFPSNKWHYNLLPLLAGIPRRIGFAYHYHPWTTLGFLLNERCPVDPMLHDVEQNRSLAAFFTKGPPAIEPPVFPCIATDADRAWAREFDAPNAERWCIAVHPGSSAENGMDAKRWPAKRFGQVADHLAEQFSAHIYILGGPDEEPLKRAMLDAMRQPATVVAPVSLARTSALLALCDACLANDSGIMHLAACQGVPTIAIFGPTDPRRNGPIGAESLIVRREMAGFPLWTAENVGNRRVPKGKDPQESLQALTAQEALELIEPWLAKVWSCTKS
jgi:lipopolysaccharide heptosyltransferase II